MRRMGWQFTPILLAALLVAALSAPIPAATSTGRIGIVNVSRIMAELPEFQKYNQQYAAEQKSLMPKAPAAKGKIKPEDRAKMEASLKKWQKIKEQFISHTMDKVRMAAEKVQKDKKLDFVLVDAPWNPSYPLAQDGAEDVTTDVLFAMKGR